MLIILVLAFRIIWAWWDIFSDIYYTLTIKMFSIDRLNDCLKNRNLL